MHHKHGNIEHTESDQREGGKVIMVEGKGRDQTICMNDPQTWKTVQDYTVGAGGGMVREGQRETNGDNCNRITIKNE